MFFGKENNFKLYKNSKKMIVKIIHLNFYILKDIKNSEKTHFVRTIQLN